MDYITVFFSFCAKVGIIRSFFGILCMSRSYIRGQRLLVFFSLFVEASEKVNLVSFVYGQGQTSKAKVLDPFFSFVSVLRSELIGHTWGFCVASKSYIRGQRLLYSFPSVSRSREKVTLVGFIWGQGQDVGGHRSKVN